MFGLFKKKTAFTAEELFNTWYEACFAFLDQGAMNTPRGKIGLASFFIGSIDAICQHNKMDDENWLSLTEQLITSVGFPSGFSKPIVRNYYLENKAIPLVQDAIIEGGKSVNNFLSGQNKIASTVLLTMTSNWVETPELNPEEIEYFMH